MIEYRGIYMTDDEIRDITVIAVSANAMESDIAAAKDAGICDYVTKPYNLKDIVAAIKKAVA